MNKNLLLVCSSFLLSLITTCELHAASGAQSPAGYLFTVKRPMPLSVGASYDIQPLILKYNGFTERADVKHTYGLIGIDPLQGISLYGRAGENSVTLKDSNEKGSGFEWGAGLKVRLIDYMLDAPYYLKGRWGLDAAGEYSGHKADIDTTKMDWKEKTGSLTLNWELRDPFTYGKDWEECYSLVLGAGVAYSDVSGDFDRRTFSANGRAGFIGSADIFLARNLSIGAETRVFDKAEARFSVAFHF